MASAIPAKYRALSIPSVKADLELITKTTPIAEWGSVVVRVLSVGIISYQRDVYAQTRPYPLPYPIVGGNSAIGRVLAIGPDATVLRPGDLVWADNAVRGRDDPSAMYLCGFHEGMTEQSRTLSHGPWRDSTFAEVVRFPLENCIKLDEKLLCGEMGYSINQLAYLLYLTVPFGGLRDVRVEAGETVVVVPATGGFGGAGVPVAAAMGARVVAMGRNEVELKRLKAYMTRGMPWAKVETVKIAEDRDALTAALQKFAPVDAILDLPPPAAAKSTYLQDTIPTLRKGGRISEMGVVAGPIVGWHFIGNDVTLKGKFMYDRDDLVLFVKMLERGLFPKGEDLVTIKEYKLEQWKEAFDEAAVYTGLGRLVVINP